MCLLLYFSFKFCIAVFSDIPHENNIVQVDTLFYPFFWLKLNNKKKIKSFFVADSEFFSPPRYMQENLHFLNLIGNVINFPVL